MIFKKVKTKKKKVILLNSKAGEKDLQSPAYKA